MKSFEDYLIDKHAAQYCGLDDDMPDNFNDWLCDLDPDEFIAYAEDWKQGPQARRFHVMYKGNCISKHNTEEAARDKIQKLKKINPAAYEETIPGSTPLSIKILPEDIAKAYFDRAAALDKYGKLDLTLFLAQVYGICGQHIRESETTQRCIESLLQLYYK